MADHIHKQITDTLAAALITAAVGVDDRVYTNRSSPLASTQLPAIQIDEEATSIEPLVMSAAPYAQNRTGALAIQITTKAEDADALAYDILKAVEHSLAANITLSSLVKYIYPSAIEWERTAEGDQAIVRATLTATFLASTMNNAVDVPL